MAECTTKVCRGCNAEKPIGAFSRNKDGGPSGLRSRCKDCDNARSRQRVVRDPEKVRARRRELAKAKRESGVPSRRVDPAYFREWRASHPGYYREWVRAHPELVAKHNARTQAIRRGAIVVGDVDRFVVYARDGGMCHICRRRVNPRKWHLDHLVPISRGGEHSERNVAVAHPRCNLRRGARGPAQLRLW